jgi:hypothetical protein
VAPFDPNGARREWKVVSSGSPAPGWLISLFAVACGVFTVYRGRFEARGLLTITRDENPTVFWAIVLFFFLVAAIALWMYAVHAGR